MPSAEQSLSTIFIDSPTYLSSASDNGYTGNFTGSTGSNHPNAPYPSGSSQSGYPGSNNNNNGTPEPVPDFDFKRRQVGAKLRDLFVFRPPRTSIYMDSYEYSDRITRWDHNIVCKALIDIKHPLMNKITSDEVNGCRYTGIVTLELLSVMER